MNWGLRAEWVELFGSDYGFDDLVSRYGEKHRHYHTLDHIIYAVQTCLHSPAFRTPPPRPALAALFFHDVVYDPTSTTNEEDSAVYAVDMLRRHGIHPESRELVARLIMLTKHHQPDFGTDALGSRVTDCDLAGLAHPWDDYVENSRDIRQEYSEFDDTAWSKGRVRFLQSMLERRRIFGVKDWEEPARRNMQRELELLEKEGKPI